MRFLRGRPSEESLDKELRFHLESQIADYVTAGLSPEEARRRALLEFGGVDLAKEECRDVRPWRWLDALARDIRYAVRGLARDPGFTATSLIVLALGIGGVTAIFTVINELAIQTPPFEQPERIAVISEQVEDFRAHVGSRFPPDVNFFRLRSDLKSFEDVTACQFAMYELRGLEEPISVTAVWTPSNFASVLGFRLLMGRWFTEDELRADEPVVVVSEDLWRRVFHADPKVLGRSVELVGYRENRPFTVIGIAPRITRVPRLAGVEIFTPKHGYLDREKSSPSWIAGRLAEGATFDQARAELAGVQMTLFPDQNYTNGGKLIHVRSVVSDSIQLIRDGLTVLFGAALCVLLIACANVASLLLGRSASRRREMAVRAGLGASAGRLFTQTLTESLLLASLGGALGVFVAWAGVRGLMAIRYAFLPELERTAPDLTVLAFAICVAGLTALLFGAIPAWTAARTDPFDTLRLTGATSGEGFSGKRLRQALVAAEVAISLVLVAGAGLLVHSVARMLEVDAGFEVRNTLYVDVRPPQGMGNEQLGAFYGEVESRLRAVPGIVDAGGINFRPPQRVFYTMRYRLPEQSFASRDDAPFLYARIATAGYFDALKIPVLDGQTFPTTGAAGVSRVAISRSLAEHLWPGESAIGRALILWEREEKQAQVVAVVGDVRIHSLTEEPGHVLYLDNAEHGRANDWLIRTDGDPMALLPAIKEAIRKVDPTQPFREVSTLEEDLARETAEPRFYMFLLSAFAVVALLLAAVGLYGVVAFSAARRTQEIGVRMALGADRPRILRMFASEGLWPAGIGAVAGLGGALALGRFLEAWLYGVTPADPLTLAAVCVLLGGVAWLASYLPARKAARLHPLEALRYE